MKRFYVYAYFDPRVHEHYNICGQDFNYKPIYIGKGQGTRVLKHIKSNKKSKLVNLNKHLIEVGLVPHYQILEYFEDEVDANNREMELISEIGREDLNQGPLFNLTNGGEGKSGIIWSKEAREAVSIHRKKYFSSLSKKQLKEHGQRSLKNRDPENVKEGVRKGAISKSLWPASHRQDVEERRRASWEKSYCNTQDKRDQRRDKCTIASLKRKMYYLTYEREDGSIGEGFLKDLISKGWGKDALEWRIKGKMPLEKPYRVKVDQETIVIKSVDKRAYSSS